MYRGVSAKNCSRDGRRQSETRVHLQSLSFFRNIKNKQHLNSLFVNLESIISFWFYFAFNFYKINKSQRTGVHRNTQKLNTLQTN